MVAMFEYELMGDRGVKINIYMTRGTCHRYRTSDSILDSWWRDLAPLLREGKEKKNHIFVFPLTNLTGPSLISFQFSMHPFSHVDKLYPFTLLSGKPLKSLLSFFFFWCSLIIYRSREGRNIQRGGRSCLSLSLSPSLSGGFSLFFDPSSITLQLRVGRIGGDPESRKREKRDRDFAIAEGTIKDWFFDASFVIGFFSRSVLWTGNTNLFRSFIRLLGCATDRLLTREVNPQGPPPPLSLCSALPPSLCGRYLTESFSQLPAGFSTPQTPPPFRSCHGMGSWERPRPRRLRPRAAAWARLQAGTQAWPLVRNRHPICLSLYIDKIVRRSSQQNRMLKNEIWDCFPTQRIHNLEAYTMTAGNSYLNAFRFVHFKFE